MSIVWLSFFLEKIMLAVDVDMVQKRFCLSNRTGKIALCFPTHHQTRSRPGQIVDPSNLPLWIIGKLLEVCMPIFIRPNWVKMYSPNFRS